MTDFTQREIPIEWLLAEVSPEMAATSPGLVEREVRKRVQQRYAAAGEVPVHIEWHAFREVITGVPELINDWTPGNAWPPDMPTPTRIFCQGRPDLPGSVIRYIDTNESGDG